MARKKFSQQEKNFDNGERILTAGEKSHDRRKILTHEKS